MDHEIWPLLGPIILAVITAGLGWAGARGSRKALESDLALRDKVPEHLQPVWDVVIERRVKAIAGWSIVPRISRIAFGLAVLAVLSELVIANRISSMRIDFARLDEPSEAVKARDLLDKIELWDRYGTIALWAIGLALLAAAAGLVAHSLRVRLERRSETPTGD